MTTALANLPSPLYPLSLAQWHQRYRGPLSWRLTPTGVECRPALRAPDAEQLAMVQAVMRRYAVGIAAAANTYRVPPELLVATIATESSGNPDSVRFEPGYKSDIETPARISVGLMQTLISTARAAVPNAPVTRKWLSSPDNSILAGAAYIASQFTQTAYDPPLVAACYNAGRLQQEAVPGNPWRLLCYPPRTGQHVTRFVRLYNAAVALRYGIGN